MTPLRRVSSETRGVSRQVLTLTITMATLDGARLTMTMAELLPGAFGTDHMDADHKDRD